MRIPSVPIRLALLVLLLAGPALNACRARAGLLIGNPIKTVVVNDLRGRPMNLPGDLKGKVALVRFWSLDCHFCDKETLLSLESLYQKYQDKGFVPVAIHESRPNQSDPRLRRFENLTYPMLVDDTGKVGKQFGVVAMPITFILDEEGILREKIVGEAKIEILERLITKVLDNRGFYDDGY